MLSPRYLDGLSDELIEIYSQLENDILQDMARRIKRLGKVTDATQWQAKMLNEAGGLKGDVNRILRKYDKQVREQVEKTVTNALETSVKNDNRIFKEATGRTVSTANAQSMLSTIQKCHSDLSRLTLTTAATTQTQFVKEANRVYMDVQSGAFDYDTAMKSAADELAKQGIRTVQYENGKPVTRSVESAVRMNILTSVNQSAANMTLNNADELGAEKFEVSAHIGARPEHEEWQGGIYTREQLETVCGLGEATGLCGINCRHSFYPYFEGTEKHYTQDDLDEMAGEKVSFTDKDGNKRTITRYEGEQRLRSIERNIRKYKRQALTEEAAGADNTLARRKLGEWQANARNFTKQTGIARDSAREYVGTSGKQPTGLREIAKSRKESITLAPNIKNFKSTDILNTYMDKVQKDGNYFDVAMHGTKKSVIYNDKEINWRELAKIISNNPDFKRQNGIRLLSCSTGKGENSFAQNLANKLNCKVKAPSDLLYVNTDGSMYIGKHGNGKWIVFKPRAK